MGFVLRLSQANGYSGIREFLQLMGLEGAHLFRKNMFNLYADREKLTKLGRIGTGDAAHLERFYAAPLPAPIGEAEALYREECRVELDALLPERAAFCPACLKDQGYVRDTWDLAPVTACVQHATVLIDECPTCQSPITWNRAALFHCPHCAADLRAAQPEGAGDDALAVVADFEALAPFRCRDNTGRPFVVEWEEMFHAFKVLLLPAYLWAEDNGQFPAAFVSDSSVEQRHAAVERLAGIRNDGTYDVSKLRERGEKALAPLAGLPIRHALEDTAVRYLSVTVGLSPELAAAIAGVDTLEEDVAAAEVYDGRPPSLETSEQVEDFLRVSATDVMNLFNLGVIAPRSNSLIGHDADHLLGARKLLDSLLGLDELTELVGVPVHESDLHPDGLFPRWNTQNRTDARVMPQRAIELQLQLAARWHRASPPDKWVPLRTMAQSVERPCALVTGVAKAIIMGSIDRFVWKSPFSWSDLGIPVGSVDTMLRLGRA